MTVLSWLYVCVTQEQVSTLELELNRAVSNHKLEQQTKVMEYQSQVGSTAAADVADADADANIRSKQSLQIDFNECACQSSLLDL